MKKIITTLFVVAVNFYFACFALGIAAGLYTIEQGPIPLLASFFIPVAALLISILYQLNRQRFSFFSPGELLVSNTNKTDLLDQHKLFTITRAPLFLLLLLTLLLSGNLLDGLSEGSTFTLPQLFSLALVYMCLYRGLLRYFLHPTFSGAMLTAAGLVLGGFLVRFSGPVGIVLAYIFFVLTALWVVAWAIYRRFRLPVLASA